MASVNKVILIGNLGKDPEVRYTPNGNAVCNLRLATTRNWKDKATGDKVEETEWHSVVLYDRQAEVAGEYLRKGRPVYIEGRLKTRKWQDKDGNDRYTTEIVADSMQLLGGREGMGAPDDGGDRGERAEPGRAASRGADVRPGQPVRSCIQRAASAASPPRALKSAATPARSSALRFWLSFHLPVHAVTRSSSPTIALSIVSR